MRRTVLWVVGIVALAVAGSGILLNQYKDALVYTVVINATLQKASPDEKERIEGAFERARAESERNRRSKMFLETLFAVSQKVEKVQRLSAATTDGIVRMLDEFSENAKGASKP